MQNSTPAEWLVAIGTLALAVVAVYQEKIRAWLSRPNLELAVINRSPDCHRTRIALARSGMAVSGTTASGSGGEVIHEVYAYYLHVRVRNAGGRRAENVEVYARDLSREQADGTFVQVAGFMPMNLLWSHLDTAYMSAISPGMEKMCDLAHVIDPAGRHLLDKEALPGAPEEEPILSWDLQVRPNSLTHLSRKGRYRIVLVVGSGNSKPKTYTVEVVLNAWHQSEDEMLSQGIAIGLA